MKHTLMLLLLVSCQTAPTVRPASTVDYSPAQIRDMIVDQFKFARLTVPKIGAFKDSVYAVPRHQDMVDALDYIAANITPKLTYRSEASDCDNFSGLVGNIIPFLTDDRYLGKSIPLGKIDLYWDTPHEVLAWIDDEGFWIAEPQATGEAEYYHISALPQFRTIYRVDPI